MTEIIKVRIGGDELAAKAKEIIEGWDNYSIRTYLDKEGNVAGFRPARPLELGAVARQIAEKYLKDNGFRVRAVVSTTVKSLQDTVDHVYLECSVDRIKEPS